jgi:hypothetical protein
VLVGDCDEALGEKARVVSPRRTAAAFAGAWAIRQSLLGVNASQDQTWYEKQIACAP